MMLPARPAMPLDLFSPGRRSSPAWSMPYGGGGLIQIPFCSVTIPGGHPDLVRHQQAGQHAGTSAALWRYARSVPDATLAGGGAAALAALAGALVGAAVVAWLLPARRCVRWCCATAAIYTFRRSDFAGHERRVDLSDRWRAVLFGAVIGFYDGFFDRGRAAS